MMENDPYTGWQPEFKMLIEKLGLTPAVNSVLEFGLGMGTYWLTDHFFPVHSVELATKQEHIDWYWRTVAGYNGDSLAWTHHLHNADDLKIGDELARSGYYPSPNDLYGPMMDDLRGVVKEAFTQQYWDIVFVDPGIHLRGTLVEICFDYDPLLIIADDIKEKRVYGYDRVKVPGGWSYWEGERIGAWMTMEMMEGLKL